MGLFGKIKSVAKGAAKVATAPARAAINKISPSRPQTSPGAPGMGSMVGSFQSNQSIPGVGSMTPGGGFLGNLPGLMGQQQAAMPQAPQPTMAPGGGMIGAIGGAMGQPSQGASGMVPGGIASILRGRLQPGTRSNPSDMTSLLRSQYPGLGGN